MPYDSNVYVHLLPAFIPAGSLPGGIAVVVDVLRATTAMVHALHAGIEAIIPCLEVNEARAIADSFPKGSVILGGERQGLPIEGFDLGNSPMSYTPEICQGKTLVMTTTNGTRAIHASLDAERILIAAFANVQKTISILAAFAGPVHVVCAGTDGNVSLEDTLLAGLMAHELTGNQRPFGNDSSQIACGFWLDQEARFEGSNALADSIGRGRGGCRVKEIGLARDIEDAGRIDSFDFSAELVRSQEPYRIVRI